MVQLLCVLIIPILLALLIAFIIGKYQDKKVKDTIALWNYIDSLNNHIERWQDIR